jgi:hypothetical protein
MKWLRNKKANLGDQREVIRFAFLPVFSDDYIIWMEKYISIEEYNRWIIDEMHGYVESWQVKERKAFV